MWEIIYILEPVPITYLNLYAMKYLHERLIGFQGKIKSVAVTDAMSFFQQRLLQLHVRIKAFEFQQSMSALQQELIRLPARIRAIQIREIPKNIKISFLQFLKDIKLRPVTPN